MAPVHSAKAAKPVHGQPAPRALSTQVFDLPNELLVQILKDLGPPTLEMPWVHGNRCESGAIRKLPVDFRSLSLTCRHWHRLVQSVVLPECAGTDPLLVCNALMAYPRCPEASLLANTRHFYLGASDFDLGGHLSFLDILPVVCPSLRLLNIAFTRKGQWPTIAKRLAAHLSMSMLVICILES